MYIDQILYIIYKRIRFLGNKPIFYDTDCLSCFLITDKCNILKSLFSKIIIPHDVYNELNNSASPYKIRKILKF
jgi:predicted nucleic acid-binding protein